MPGHLATDIVASPKYCYRESGENSWAPKDIKALARYIWPLQFATEDDSTCTVEIYLAKSQDFDWVRYQDDE